SSVGSVWPPGTASRSSLWSSTLPPNGTPLQQCVCVGVCVCVCVCVCASVGAADFTALDVCGGGRAGGLTSDTTLDHPAKCVCVCVGVCLSVFLSACVCVSDCVCVSVCACMCVCV